MANAFPTKIHSYSPTGFTLVEMIVTIAVLFIVLGIAAPSAKRIIDSHRIAADINHTNAIIRYARIYAINQYETTLVCPSYDHVSCSSNWQYPLIVFVDENSNKTRDPNEALLAASTALSKQHKMKGPTTPIRFSENGENASPASLTLCPVSNDNTLARALFVSLQGRIRLSKDDNNDGIDDRVKNTNLECTSF